MLLALAYLPEADDVRAVSLTMPMRLTSYEQDYGLHPIFEMNLPEGALRERLRLTFAKETGKFDDLDILAITGRSQMGRIRYTARDAELDEEVPFQAVDEILARRRDGSLLAHLIQRFAAYSGISGVQPKVLIRDESEATALRQSRGRASQSFRGATHIVKFWHPDEFPQLAANEFFCMKAAERAGLDVPRLRLAEDGAALVVDRFDLTADGRFLGLEDFCVLNGKHTSEKYDGSYERAVFRRLKDYVTDAEAWRDDAERLFMLFALNCAIRNGDAHLKNFALVYDDVLGTPRLAPAYDLVTTAAYLPGIAWH
jgi:serine/threonine-protein kinase HipA